MKNILRKNGIQVIGNKIRKSDEKKAIEVLSRLKTIGESEVKILWSKPIGSYADDDDIEMQEALLEKMANKYGGEGAFLYPEECDVDRNFMVVYKPSDANIEDVCKALMSEEGSDD